MGSRNHFLSRAFAYISAFVGVCFAANLLLGWHFARKVLTPPKRFETPLKAIDFNVSNDGHKTITFSAGEDAALTGFYSFVFNGEAKSVRVGQVLENKEGKVTRELLDGDIEKLRPGIRGRLTGWWFKEPAEVGSFEKIEFRSDYGKLPAWHFVQGATRSKTVVIHVHGRNAPRRETLRGVNTLRALGVDSLVIGYRNDRDTNLRGKTGYGLGYSEWRDVSQAMVFAKRTGYEKIIIFAWSMGGTASILAASQSSARDKLVGLIFDSPAFDWPGILKHQARIARVPTFIAQIGMRIIEHIPWLVRQRIAIPVQTLNPEALASLITVPTLLMVSEGDTFVPHDGAIAAARHNKKYIKLHNHSGGEHVKLWNHNSDEWEKVVTKFIVELDS